MQAPIAAGTILQNRYRLHSILGQGGFGRTYLAYDQGRFDEPCALKEFIPTQAGAYALEKSRELFQREAAILYQIQHPQIPQFRATFEEGGRLFLVQDYVEGKTYRTLLNDRKLQGMTFTEPEVLHLMRQLLPVLAHIHSKGIIHRDVAPDNIILRQQDQVPVLIDFGVVKEIVTRIQSLETVPQATTVGKVGYAPSEQMQAGRAYPNSDLYSLAVTAVVLLTGREPQDIYDDVNLTWHWQRYANVSPGLAQVINRMLSYRPGDRYQSVSEVAQALQMLGNPAGMPPGGMMPPSVQTQPPFPPQPFPQQPPFPQPPPFPQQQPLPPVPQSYAPPQQYPLPPAASQTNPDLSRMNTMAVGRRAQPTTPVNAPTSYPGPSIPDPNTDRSVWDNPWAVLGIGTGLAVVTGIGAWAIVSAILNTNQPQPIATPTPVPTVTVTPTPTPTPTETPAPSPSPQELRQTIALTPGSSTSVEGTLRSNERMTYVLDSLEEGETLTASLASDGLVMTILDPNNEIVEGAQRIVEWQGLVGRSGPHAIRLVPQRGVESSEYRLSISLEGAAQPEPSPVPSPNEPEVVSESIQFSAGATSAEVSDNVSDRLIRRYILNARAGQVMTLEITQGNAVFDVLFPGGQRAEDGSGVVFWQSQLPEGGDYLIDVRAEEDAGFTLKVSVVDGQ